MAKFCQTTYWGNRMLSAPSLFSVKLGVDSEPNYFIITTKGGMYYDN